MMKSQIEKESTLTNLNKTERFWYALYTRPRFEKIVDGSLKQKGLESFLPLYAVTRYWSDRKKVIAEPLFPSYIFVHANAKERYFSLQTRGVVRMVSFNGQPTSIPDEQIERIHQILNCGYNPEPHQFLNFGDEVEIVTGALQGLHGFYIEKRGKCRIVISVHAIQQSIAIEVERGQVRRVRLSEQLKQNKSVFKHKVEMQ
ncbi:MAG: UpxY family transcription antiterminator [bacterium]